MKRTDILVEELYGAGSQEYSKENDLHYGKDENYTIIVDTLQGITNGMEPKKETQPKHNIDKIMAFFKRVESYKPTPLTFDDEYEDTSYELFKESINFDPEEEEYDDNEDYFDHQFFSPGINYSDDHHYRVRQIQWERSMEKEKIKKIKLILKELRIYNQYMLAYSKIMRTDGSFFDDSNYHYLFIDYPAELEHLKQIHKTLKYNK